MDSYPNRHSYLLKSSRYNWFYKTEPDPGMNNRSLYGRAAG